MTTDNDAPAAGLVEALPATGEYVDRLIRVFRDKPHDDTSAVILQDYALAALQAPQEAGVESIETYFARQIEWSGNTFGPALRTKGVIDHIRKELMEIEAEPHDLSEWIDVVILAMDGFWRHGGSAADLLPRLLAKQAKNMARTWPDWRTLSEDSAIEHDRSGEGLSQPVATPAPSQDAAVVRLEGEIARLEDELSEARQTWPEWARRVYAFMRKYGFYESSEDDIHLPDDLEGWFDETIETEVNSRLAATRPAEAQAVAEWAVDREMIARAAADPNLSDASVRLLCIAKTGEVTDEVQAWADSVIAASPATGGA